MSYTVLAVKWRPRRFEALVGQKDVVRALMNSLTAGRLHHAYLFSGTRGVGKTTIARILAKALNCENGVSAEPCGECGACTAIDEGRFVDLIEVDAASRTRVDDTRELLDNVQYMPTRGRFKVYLIDEVHMLSAHSFNALLKTLEEPPPHVKFLFATTDPQKLPVTVLSRCLQFNLKKLPAALIGEQLGRIVESEGIGAESEALEAIARAADGSMRDALSLLDQAIAFGGGSIAADDVGRMLGSIDRDEVSRILKALAARDGASLLDEVDRLDEHGRDFGAALDEVMAALQRIAVIQLVGGRAIADEDGEWQPLAERLDPEEVQLYYQIALGGRRDIGFCRDERMSFEMTLLRMLAFRPVTVERGHAEIRPKPAVREKPGPSPAKHERPERSAARAQKLESLATAGNQRGSAGITDWPALVRDAGLRGAVGTLADHCELKSVEGARLALVLAEDKSNFNTDQLRRRLEEALSAHLRRKLSVVIKAGQPSTATPAEIRRAGEDERMRRTREAIEQDPNIQAVQAAFDAVLEPDSIQPAGPKA
ncbi:MAG TPA: DNA polymerase III subunit gamma/tau [Gammaproteobacteria bacterium]|nr:DNA polymerase III subunit gamma/tau [Gammaproteobacteria bacterium]